MIFGVSNGVSQMTFFGLPPLIAPKGATREVLGGPWGGFWRLWEVIGVHILGIFGRCCDVTLEVIWEHMLEIFGRFRDVILEMSWLCLRAAWSILVLSLRKKTLHAKRFLKEQRPSPNRVCIYSYRSSLEVLGGISNVGQQEG